MKIIIISFYINNINFLKNYKIIYIYLYIYIFFLFHHIYLLTSGIKSTSILIILSNFISK